jgi:hypothetical protein
MKMTAHHPHQANEVFIHPRISSPRNSFGTRLGDRKVKAIVAMALHHKLFQR